MQRVWSTYLAPSSGSNAGHGQDLGGGVRRSVNANRLFRTLRKSRRRPLDAVAVSKVLAFPHHRASSIASHASSQRPILVDNDNMALEPPSAPFAGLSTPVSPTGSFRTAVPLSASDGSTTNSLSLNYLPTKFSGPLSLGGLYKRKGKSEKPTAVLPKQGGGREAFKSGESRMPGERDEDYDGVDINRGTWKSKLRWNRFKWIIFCTNALVSVYSLVGLIFCLLTWFNVWKHADIIRVANRSELILSTIAAACGILTSLLGWAGILLNNRGFLATYTVCLWIVFVFVCAPGYITYKKRTFNLEGKVNAQWSRDLGMDGRVRIQNQLGCCGYYSPFVEASASQLCFARSMLPGCKNPYLKFERTTLERWYGAAFTIVPFHLLAILAGLLCSNHVTYRFGKGMTPKAYRLNMSSMAIIMDNYANQLAEQFGVDVASEIISRSKSNLQLDSIPSLNYGGGTKTPPITPGYPTFPAPVGVSTRHDQYTSINTIPSDYEQKRL